MDRYFNANAVLSIFSKNYMELKKGLPVRPSEMGVLNIITSTDGPHTPVVLANKLRVSKPMITAHIISLENKGYITKIPSEQDKRVYYIMPTDKGLELVEYAKVDLDEKLAYLEKELGQESFCALVGLAEKANAIMDANGDERCNNAK